MPMYKLSKYIRRRTSAVIPIRKLNEIIIMITMTIKIRIYRKIARSPTKETKESKTN